MPLSYTTAVTKTTLGTHWTFLQSSSPRTSSALKPLQCSQGSRGCLFNRFTQRKSSTLVPFRRLAGSSCSGSNQRHITQCSLQRRSYCWGTQALRRDLLFFPCVDVSSRSWHLYWTVISSSEQPYRSFASHTQEKRFSQTCGVDSNSFRLSCVPKAMARDLQTYEDAVSALNGLQSNASILKETQTQKKKAEEQSIPQMESFLQRIDIHLSDLDRLNVIHISGTKGKGSVAAYCESIMRHSGLKTGFYSSPHLVEVRERIRLNGRPLEHHKFTRYFFECYNALVRSAAAHDNEMPAYFRFLTLMAYHVFLAEGVDVAIVEVGIGGAYDCTNVLRQPSVCGITKLELDHTKVLGKTVEQIAWHKAGIMKPGVPVVALPQVEQAEKVLHDRAEELCTVLNIAPPLSSYESDISVNVKFQELNVSLALQLCRLWFSKMKDLSHKNLSLSTTEYNTLMNLNNSTEEHSKFLQPFSVPQVFKTGIEETRWPGRCQVVKLEKLTFYIDGAHTEGSTRACKEWAMSRIDDDLPCPREDSFRVLVFYITGERDEVVLLKILSEIGFDYAVFCPAILDSTPTRRNSDLSNYNVTADSTLKTCQKNYKSWIGLHSNRTLSESETEDNEKSSKNNATCFDSVSSAIRWIACDKDDAIGEADRISPDRPVDLVNAEHVQIVVTGSLHLIGTVMKFLGPEICEI